MRRARTIPPLSIALLLTLCPPGTSQPIDACWSWSYPGLTGAPVVDVDFRGASEIFAAAGSTLLYSANDGESW